MSLLLFIHLNPYKTKPNKNIMVGILLPETALLKSQYIKRYVARSAREVQQVLFSASLMGISNFYLIQENYH
jgi:hypothetical protein